MYWLPNINPFSEPHLCECLSTVPLSQISSCACMLAGETIAECAVREVMEETGIKIRHRKTPETFSSTLNNPTAFAAADLIWHDQVAGKLKFHYANIEVCDVMVQTHKWYTTIRLKHNNDGPFLGLLWPQSLGRPPLQDWRHTSSMAA